MRASTAWLIRCSISSCRSSTIMPVVVRGHVRDRPVMVVHTPDRSHRGRMRRGDGVEGVILVLLHLLVRAAGGQCQAPGEEAAREGERGEMAVHASGLCMGMDGHRLEKRHRRFHPLSNLCKLITQSAG